MVSSRGEGPKARSQKRRARMRPLARKREREDLRKAVVRMGRVSALGSERTRGMVGVGCSEDEIWEMSFQSLGGWSEW